MIKTIWEYSLNLEVLRVIEVAYEIVTGFFKKQHFPILPYSKEIIDPQSIIFPNLQYKRIVNFWKKVKKIEYEHTPIKAKPELVEEVKKLLIALKTFTPDFQLVKDQWEKAQKEVIGAIETIMPDKKGAIKDIVIYPTFFGSRVSFNIPKKFPAQIKLYLREDSDIYALTEGIISALIKNNVMEKLNCSWEESEIAVDLLITQSKISFILAKYAPNSKYQSTIKSIRFQQKGQLVKKSEAFYKKLGLQIGQSVFSVKNCQSYINQKPITGLTEREKKILVKLINLKGRVLSYDEFGDMVFENEDDFNLYVLAKIIQNLRDKLASNNISGCFIQSVRNHGYCLIA